MLQATLSAWARQPEKRCDWAAWPCGTASSCTASTTGRRRCEHRTASCAWPPAASRSCLRACSRCPASAACCGWPRWDTCCRSCGAGCPRRGCRSRAPVARPRWAPPSSLSRAIRGSRLSPLTAELLGASLALVPAMASLRGSQVAGYHGAEHKAIGGYEHGQAAEQATKEHDRCGSHMVGPMLAATVVGNVLVNRLPASRRGPARLVAGVAAIGAATEVFGWMTRHHDNPVSRALRWPGYELQRVAADARADRAGARGGAGRAARGAAAGGRRAANRLAAGFCRPCNTR